MQNAKQRIGQKIQQIRKENRLTQTQLGEKIGKSESTIRKYEAGSVEPSFKVLADISKELNIEIGYFLKIEPIESELDKQRLLDFESDQSLRLDSSFSNIEDLITRLIETDLFEKEFDIDYKKLSEDEKQNLINDIYKSIEFSCFKINK